MKVVVIETDVNQKIIAPGAIVVRRHERVSWICEDFDLEIVFDAPHNPGLVPPHPFMTAPPVPPPGHVSANAGDFPTRRVRPRAGASTIPDGTRYKYNIIIKNPGTAVVVDHLDPDLIVQGDK